MDVTNGKQEQEHARRVRLAVTIGGHDATDALAPSLLSATYTDNAAGKATKYASICTTGTASGSGSGLPRKGPRCPCVSCARTGSAPGRTPP